MGRRGSTIEALDPATRERLKRDLRTAERRRSRLQEQADQAAAERDRVIRDAHAAGMTPTEIGAEVDLSSQRIDQIRRGGRL